MPEKKSIKNSITQIKFRHVEALLFMLVLLSALSFYLTDGYVRIGDDKYDAFIRIVPSGLVLWLVSLIADVAKDKCKISQISEWIKTIFGGKQGLFVCLFAISSIVSTLTSNYRLVSVKGNSGWYMGMCVILLMVGLYFVSADFFGYSSKIYQTILIYGIVIITSTVFILGILNRYSIYPFRLYGHHEDYISTLGNINWYCGYWSIWMALGCGLFMYSRTGREKIIFGIYVVLATIAGITCGASAAYLALGAVFLSGIMVSCVSRSKMKRWLIMVMLQASSLPIIRIIGLFRVNRMWYDSSFLRSFSFSGLGILIWTIVCIICAGLLKLLTGNDENKNEKKTDCGLVRGRILGILAGTGIAIICIIILNSAIRGGIWPFRGIGLLTFNDNWGNGRGLIWRISVDVIKETPAIRLVFGAGCDCFCSYAYSIESVAVEIYQKWGSLILTNAHNEAITMFINQGLFGLVTYTGVMFSHLFPAYAKSDPVDGDSDRGKILCAGIMAVSAYMAIGLVGFMHILSTPLIFIMMGAVAGLIKRDTLNIMN